MTRERILDTRTGGAVCITCPAEEAILYLRFGITTPWHPWAPYGPEYWREQVRRMTARGVLPDAATRYARAMVTGGCSRREAIEIIAARDVGHLGKAIEIVDLSEIPTDRTYREAWRRSDNGGPIWIDDYKAREIDEERAWREYETA